MGKKGSNKKGERFLRLFVFFKRYEVVRKFRRSKEEKGGKKEVRNAFLWNEKRGESHLLVVETRYRSTRGRKGVAGATYSLREKGWDGADERSSHLW